MHVFLFLYTVHAFIYLFLHHILFLNETYGMVFCLCMRALYSELKMVTLQSKCSTREDFFEINILSVRKKKERVLVYLW